jgi:hypothetical protein
VRPGLPPGLLDSIVKVTEVATLVLSVLAPFVWWIAVSLMMQLVTRFFGGEGPLSAMPAVVGVTGVPLALGAFFQTIGAGLQVALGVEHTAGTVAGLLGRLAAPAALVWYVVIEAALARRIGYCVCRFTSPGHGPPLLPRPSSNHVVLHKGMPHTYALLLHVTHHRLSTTCGVDLY